MDEKKWFTAELEALRPRLHAVAQRMLGSADEAEDAVQEAWLRLSRADANDVENLGGWLTTVVSRVCLDMLRARRSHAEVPLEAGDAESIAADDAAADPERELLVADALGPAMMVVLDALAPAERVAFVLHDMFGVSFDDIAAIVGRSPVAARQLASRARRRVRGAAPVDEAFARRRRVVDAFLAAARGGDFAALLAVLDPNVALDVDDAARRLGATELRGADAVAKRFNGAAHEARVVLVRGVPGIAWMPGGRLRVVFDMTIDGDKILAIRLVGDPDRIAELGVQVLET